MEIDKVNSSSETSNLSRPIGWSDFANWHGPNIDFHDSEIIEVFLTSGDESSYLIINVLNSKGEWRLFKIKWRETIRMTLQGWHSQNVALEIRFFGRFEETGFEIDGSVGLSGEIVAKSVSISPLE